MSEPWEEFEDYVYTVDATDPYAVLKDKMAGALFDLRAEFEGWADDQRWSSLILSKHTRDKMIRIADDALDAMLWTTFGLAPKDEACKR